MQESVSHMQVSGTRFLSTCQGYEEKCPLLQKYTCLSHPLVYPLPKSWRRRAGDGCR